MQPIRLPGDLISVSAFVCQQVLRDQDDLISAIRIFDTVTVRRVPTADSAILELFVIAVVKSSAKEPSERQMALEVIFPSEDQRIHIGPNPVKFDSPPPHNHPIGATAVFEFRFSIRMAGLYWINLTLDGEQIGTIPLTLAIQTVEVL
jgi:hypothetical protein